MIRAARLRWKCHFTTCATVSCNCRNSTRCHGCHDSFSLRVAPHHTFQQQQLSTAGFRHRDSSTSHSWLESPHVPSSSPLTKLNPEVCCHVFEVWNTFNDFTRSMHSDLGAFRHIVRTSQSDTHVFTSASEKKASIPQALLCHHPAFLSRGSPVNLFALTLTWSSRHNHPC